MFSANENLMLRQHKRRIVERIEQTIPEEALDMGTTVMVMQVSCNAIGCVPIETAVIIIFPKCGGSNGDDNDHGSGGELIPGLPESKDGGSYKTKILKPMADVTNDDILNALPPAFEGGTRTMKSVCMYARDMMIGQITQLFGDDDDTSSVNDRITMAQYLQSCLQSYISGRCQPPKPGEPFDLFDEVVNNSNNDNSYSSTIKDTATNDISDTILSKGKNNNNNNNSNHNKEEKVEKLRPQPNMNKNDNQTVVIPSIPSKGNIVIRRVIDDNHNINTINNNHYKSNSTATVKLKSYSGVGIGTNGTSSPPTTTVTSIRGQPPKHERAIHQALDQQSNTIANLFNREHAPGIRKAGCPCCDPDNPSVIADNFLMMM